MTDPAHERSTATELGRLAGKTDAMEFDIRELRRESREDSAKIWQRLDAQAQESAVQTEILKRVEVTLKAQNERIEAIADTTGTDKYPALQQPKTWLDFATAPVTAWAGASIAILAMAIITILVLSDKKATDLNPLHPSPAAITAGDKP